jgi:hypothetical protein
VNLTTNNPIAALAELLPALVAAPLTPQTLEIHIATRAQTSLAAAQAAGSLRQLAMSLEASALQRLVVGHEGAVGDLSTLASVAMEVREALIDERRAAAQFLRDDAASRVKYDGVAMTLLGQAQDAVRHAKAAEKAAIADSAKLPESLAAAGLGPAEIAAVLAARQGTLDDAAHRHAEAAHAAQDRVDALQKFLRDPLRRLDQLGGDLATDLAARHDAACATPRLKTAADATTVAAG